MKINRVSVRCIVLCIILAIIFSGFSVRLMNFQIVNGESYMRRDTNTTEVDVRIKAARGEILDSKYVPLVTNKTVINLELDRAFLVSGTENNVISKLIKLLKSNGEKYIGELPITETAGVYVFNKKKTSEIERLKSRLGLNTYATVDNVIDAMYEYYAIPAEYDKKTALEVMAVRYSMEQADFSVTLPYTIAKNVSITTIASVKENSVVFMGVRTAEDTERNYVSGDLAAHIIGRIGPIYDADEYAELKEKGYAYSDLVGKSGIEKACEDTLRGTDGIRTIVFDADGAALYEYVKKEPIPGQTVVLTIDSGLQRLTQDTLAQRIEELRAREYSKGGNAQGGAFVAIEPSTGAVLSCASYPTYDLSTYSEKYQELLSDPYKPLYDRALYGTYMPGSTFKPCVALGALAESIINRDSTVRCNHRYTYYTSYQPTCLHTHGSINVITAIKVSCNIFFYDTGRRLGIDKINSYANMLGLGTDTGIEVPCSNGRIAGPEISKEFGQTWYEGNVIQAAIGQSDTRVTPLQMAVYCATIANNGVRMKTHLIKEIVTYNAESIVSATQPEVMATYGGTQSMIDTVKDGMMSVASNGTASSVFGRYKTTVGAKTGSPENTGNKAPNSAFIAYADYDGKQIAVASLIEEGYQGLQSAPIAKRVFDRYFGFDKPEKPVVSGDTSSPSSAESSRTTSKPAMNIDGTDDG